MTTYPPGSPAAKLAAAMDAKGFNALSLAKAAGTGTTAAQDILSGKVKRPRVDTLAKLAAAMGVSVVDLMPDAGAQPTDKAGGLLPSIAVGSHLSAGVEIGSDDAMPVPVPRKWRAVPGLVAAAVKDQSAGRLYPKGSVVVVCPLDQLGRPLAAGDKVLARVAVGGAGDHYLLMRLTVSADGDLFLSAPSAEPALDLTVTLRRRPLANGLAMPSSPRWQAEPAGTVMVDYTPQPGDDAEIVGVVVGAWLEE